MSDDELAPTSASPTETRRSLFKRARAVRDEAAQDAAWRLAAADAAGSENPETVPAEAPSATTDGMSSDETETQDSVEPSTVDGDKGGETAADVETANVVDAPRSGSKRAKRRGRRKERPADRAERSDASADVSEADAQAGEDAAPAAVSPAGAATGPRARGEARVGAALERARTVRGVVWAAFAGVVGPMLAASLIINLLTFSAPVFVLQVYDRVVPHAAFETMKGLVIAVIALVAFDALLKEARSRMMRHVGLRVDVALTRKLYAQLTRLPLRKLEVDTEADWRTRLRDADVVRDAVSGPLVLLMLDLPFAALFLTAIAFAAPPLATLLMIITPVYLAVALLSAWLVRGVSREEQDASIEKDRVAGEMIAARGMVKTLGAGEALRGRFEAAEAGLVAHAARRGGLVDGFSTLGGAMATLTTVLMTTVGVVAIIDLEMTIGGLIAANMLAARIVQPLVQLIGLWRGLERARRSADRLDDVFAEAPDPDSGAVERPRPRGEIAIENVSFGYGEGEPALRQVSLRFGPRRMLGVVGANGSGKTTLLKIAQGLYAPAEGRVLLDGADMAQFGRRELSAWAGVAPQEPFLLSGPIRDAVAMGREGVDDASILNAARLAGADGFVDALPDGFGSDVGEGGRLLSSGQRQRIALARALACDPPILLLDEPSANLDFQAERALAERLTMLKQDRAILMISHSRTLLAACDVVVVLDRGRVVATGAPDRIVAGLGDGAPPAERRTDAYVEPPAAGRPLRSVEQGAAAK